MTIPGNLDINDFTYELPDERIAQYPLPNRADSSLMVFNKGIPGNDRFYNIGNYLPSGSCLAVAWTDFSRRCSLLCVLAPSCRAQRELELWYHYQRGTLPGAPLVR